jgi:hypothetical protein
VDRLHKDNDALMAQKSRLEELRALLEERLVRFLLGVW